MIIDPTKSGQTTPAASHVARSSKAPSGSSFSTALASASTKATASSASAVHNVGTSTKVPKGEKTEHVSGHSYDEVIAGPRDGMFVNRSGNKRDGQAFAMVKRDGREFHVYGTGKNRVIVEVKHKKADDTPATPTTAAPTDNTSSSSSGDSGTATTPSPATDTTGAPVG
jgi:hypothetical protein